MIDEKSYAEKKISRIMDRTNDEIKMHEKQKEFMKKMESRYKEACNSTKSKETIRIELDPSTNLYVIKNLDLDSNKNSKEAWEPFICESPETMTEPRTEEEFKILKEKVKFAYKSKRLNEKNSQIKKKKLDMDTLSTEKQISKLSRVLFTRTNA